MCFKCHHDQVWSDGEGARAGVSATTIDQRGGESSEGTRRGTAEQGKGGGGHQVKDQQGLQRKILCCQLTNILLLSPIC